MMVFVLLKKKLRLITKGKYTMKNKKYFGGMIIKLILIATALTMVGCGMYPSLTKISASTKTTSDAEATIKVEQVFKWSQ